MHGQPTPYDPAGAQLPPLLSLLTQSFAALLSPQETHTLYPTSLLPSNLSPSPNACLVQTDFTIRPLMHCTSGPASTRQTQTAQRHDAFTLPY